MKASETVEQIKQAIGEGGLDDLLRAFGGTTICLPSVMTRDQPLSLRIGYYNAKKLHDEVGPGCIDLPVYSEQVRRRRNSRMWALKGVLTKQEIAVLFGLSTRQVRNIFRCLEDQAGDNEGKTGVSEK